MFYSRKILLQISTAFPQKNFRDLGYSLPIGFLAMAGIRNKTFKKIHQISSNKGPIEAKALNFPNYLLGIAVRLYQCKTFAVRLFQREIFQLTSTMVSERCPSFLIVLSLTSLSFPYLLLPQLRLVSKTILKKQVYLREVAVR